MNKSVKLLLAFGIALALAACTTSAGGGENAAVMQVNGRDVTAAELIKSPMVRQSIKQFLITDALMREAGKAGIYADEDEIDKQIAQIEQDALSRDMTLEEYLTKQQYVTEEEVRESIRMSQLFEKLVEAKVEITEEDRQQYWDERADEIKYSHARENHLTDAETATLTREDVATTLDDMIRQDKAGPTRSEMLDALLNGIQLDVLVIEDPKEAQLYEDLLINYSKKLPEPEATEEPTLEMVPGGPGGAPETPEEGAEAGEDAGDDGEQEPPAEDPEADGDDESGEDEPPAEPDPAEPEPGSQESGN